MANKHNERKSYTKQHHRSGMPDGQGRSTHPINKSYAETLPEKLPSTRRASRDEHHDSPLSGAICDSFATLFFLSSPLSSYMTSRQIVEVINDSFSQ